MTTSSNSKPMTMNLTNSVPFEQRMNKSLYSRRKAFNIIGLIFAMCAMAFGLFWLGWILFDLLRKGMEAMITMPIFTADTPPPGTVGGLRNAIVGSVMIAGTGLLIGAPVGLLAGIYLAEFSQGSWLGKATRFINDILLSAPSIVIGLFIFSLMVSNRSFSGWAGAVALSLIIIPVVVRSTETMLNLVPNQLREASYALGAPKWKVVTSVTMQAAKSGLITGVLLGFARITGETAPLLFTALNNRFFSWDMSSAMANLPMTIYQFAAAPDDTQNMLAWAGALIVTFSVLGLNIIARIVGRDKK